MWEISNDELTNTLFSELPEKSMIEPFPKSLWRIEKSKNGGYPFHELLPGVPALDVWSLPREHLIKVYDLHEPQTGFDHNGIAILDCISCISHHDDDKWDIDLVHPIDDWGKWKTLLPQNILKIDGQLFRIDSAIPKLSEQGYTMTVHARQIGQDLADQLITFGTFEGGTPADFITWAQNACVYWFDYGLKAYEFFGSSDIDKELAPSEYVNCTLLSALIGADNCLKNIAGGELYFDNFYFSLNQRMEHARDNAFNIRYSLDMTEIEQVVDYSDFCTNLWCYDNFGAMWSVAYTPTIGVSVHHPVHRMVQFNYEEHNFERLVQDGQALWEQMRYPRVSYTANIAALGNDPKYAEFIGLQDYRYGDSGTVYCPELGLTTVQKIVSVDKNELTGDIIRIQLGNLKKSIIRPSYMSSTITSGATVEDKINRSTQAELKKLKIRSLGTWGDVRKYKWQELTDLTFKNMKGEI